MSLSHEGVGFHLPEPPKDEELIKEKGKRSYEQVASVLKKKVAESIEKKQKEAEVKVTESEISERNQLKELYRNAVQKWGNQAQWIKAVEECGELIQAISKHMLGGEDIQHMFGEIADVEIMLGQLKFMLGEERYEVVRQAKVKELKRKIKESEQLSEREATVTTQASEQGEKVSLREKGLEFSDAIEKSAKKERPQAEGIDGYSRI